MCSDLNLCAGAFGKTALPWQGCLAEVAGIHDATYSDCRGGG